MAPQPPEMTVSLFDYQRRAIARMLLVEEGVEIDIDTAKGIRTRPRGGVLCEAVGMVMIEYVHNIDVCVGCYANNVVLTTQLTH
jgi:hypothetical protein